MRILVVEDEAAVARQLAIALSAAGYVVDQAANGARADYLVRTEQYDLALLDLGLPRVDGLALLRAWRADGMTLPVLVLTARGSWSERVLGIDSGADDYVGKPFHVEEVLARVRALLRRAHGHASPVLTAGVIALDPRSSIVTRDGRTVPLTAHEFRMLSYLMHQGSRVVSRAELTEHIYGHASERDSNTVEVFIARLRRKLGTAIIETVRGLGYRMGPSAHTQE
ncbi:MAG: response regulator transcription factor [Vicinamibacterales bacterium]